MAQIKCTDLCIGYEGRTILSGIDFEVNRGDYIVIAGKNGSGKSTLMKTLLGLVPSISGKIEFGDGFCRNETGYLPQQTDIQKDFPATVKEVVISGCQSACGIRPYYKKEEKKRAEQNMERMDVLDLKNRCYRDLSGGQQQRVLLARALSATKSLLLLDEPVAGLDPDATTRMYRLIKSLNDDGITVIMVSHDIKEAFSYADKILYVGKEIFFGEKDEYLKIRESGDDE